MRLGADVEQLEELAAAFSVGSEALQRSATDVGSAIRSAWWVGASADSFRYAWQQQHDARLRVVSDVLGQLATELRAQARAQASASEGSTFVVGIGAESSGPIVIPDLRSMTPEDRNSWFTALSDSDQRSVIESDPRLIGNLDGIPLQARYDANALTIDRALEEALSADDFDRILMLARLDAPGPAGAERSFLILDLDAPGGGRIAEVHGDLGNAYNVVVVVPGINNDLESFAEGGNLLAQGSRNIADLAGDDTAVVAWLDYDAPGAIDPSTLTEDRARQGAASLRSFLAAQTNESQNVSLVAHSYGSTVAGIASSEGLPTVDNLILLGSPGAGVQNVSEFQLADGAEVLASKSGFDPVPAFTGDLQTEAARVRYDPLGKDPTSPSFGAQVLEGPGGIWGVHGKYLDQGDLLNSIVGIVSETPPGQTDLDYGDYA